MSPNKTKREIHVVLPELLMGAVTSLKFVAPSAFVVMYSESCSTNDGQKETMWMRKSFKTLHGSAKYSTPSCRCSISLGW
jgi:hypothetical protein